MFKVTKIGEFRYKGRTIEILREGEYYTAKVLGLEHPVLMSAFVEKVEKYAMEQVDYEEVSDGV